MKRTIWMLAAMVVASTALALDAVKFEDHLRKALNLDPRTTIKIKGQPAPSGLGGLNALEVEVEGSPYTVYFTPDEKKYFWGMLMDATVDPDKERLAKINLGQVFSQGSQNAPVTVVEYSDLQCSFCRKAHEEIKKNMAATYKPEQVRIVFKHFPLSRHDWSEPAAMAVECAGQQRPAAFFDMIDLFFASNDKITAADVNDRAKRFAKDLKLDTGRFDSCYDTRATLPRVQETKREGVALGVSSTPTLFVNGRMMRGFREWGDLKVLIEDRMKVATNKK